MPNTAPNFQASPRTHRAVSVPIDGTNQADQPRLSGTIDYVTCTRTAANRMDPEAEAQSNRTGVCTENYRQSRRNQKHRHIRTPEAKVNATDRNAMRLSGPCPTTTNAIWDICVIGRKVRSCLTLKRCARAKVLGHFWAWGHWQLEPIARRSPFWPKHFAANAT